VLLEGAVDLRVVPDMTHSCGTWCTVRLVSCSADATPQVEVEAKGDRVHVCVQPAPAGQRLTCELVVPVKYDLTVQASGSANVEVRSLQNSKTSLTTQTGHTTVSKLQSLDLSFATESGSLEIPDKLYSNLDASASQSLELTGKALQSHVLRLRCPRLRLRLASVHAGRVDVDADTVDVAVGDMTAEAEIKARTGVVEMGNLSGGFSLALEEGTVRADVPLLSQDSSITVGKGKCSVASPQEYRYGIRAAAPHLNISPSFGGVRQTAGGEALFGTGEHTLQVRCDDGQVAFVPWTWPKSLHKI